MLEVFPDNLETFPVGRAVGIVMKPQAGKLRNRDSIPCSSKRHSCSTKLSRTALGPTTLLYDGYQSIVEV